MAAHPVSVNLTADLAKELVAAQERRRRASQSMDAAQEAMTKAGRDFEIFRGKLLTDGVEGHYLVGQILVLVQKGDVTVIEPVVVDEPKR